MTDLAIAVRGLGKRYRIGAVHDRHRTLRDAIVDMAAAPVRRIRHPGSSRGTESMWALRDVGFEVREGDVLGVIGRNGAGKSTLLKILSRVTEPTEGRVELWGRVGSLLEVGTGFHPELTGRENVFLNAAILGMTRAEVTRKFDEIVAFSGVERFIDTPVKRFSSGMYIRLAFAVAAHLEPEILVVDEVLAVGDVEFQKKCLQKMKSTSEEGRTVLFVSHNLPAIKRLCSRAILLDEGRVQVDAGVEVAIDSYMSAGSRQMVNSDIEPSLHRVYPAGLEVFRLELLNRHMQQTDSLMMDEPFSIRVHYLIRRAEDAYRVGLVFFGADGTRVATTVCTERGLDHLRGADGEQGSLEVSIANILLPGVYTAEVHVKTSHNELVDVIEGIQFMVADVSAASSSASRGGLVHLDAEWKPARAAARPIEAE